jgi:hypothetical protein
LRHFVKPAIVVLVVIALGMLAWIPLRSILQFRATYPGPITFIGRADGALGTEYYRVYMWRDPSDSSPLPDVTVYLRGTPYALSALTDETVQSLGGTAGEGGLKDAADYYFQYRFENGNLTYFALYPSHAALIAAPDEWRDDRFYIQVGDGPPFLFPVSHGQLVQYAGAPQDISRNIAN